MKFIENIALNIKETLENGDSIEIKFEDETYELNSSDEETLVFKIKNKYKKYSLTNLADQLIDLNEEFKDREEEYSDYDRRVEEFRYCGYNEEDPDFHGMCLHLNHIGDSLSDIEEEIFEIRNEIERRCDDLKFAEILDYLEDYGYGW